jgi:nitroreductase
MNETLRTLETRRSVRCFDPSRMPADEILEQIARAGEYAPTGMGMQSPRIVVVTDKATRDLLSRLNAQVMGTGTDPFYGAPAIMVVLADRNRPTHVYDGSLVMGNLMNAAHSLGLGSCWIHRAREVFDSAEGKRLLADWGIEGDYEGIGHVALGYALKEPAAPKPRKADYTVWVK